MLQNVIAAYTIAGTCRMFKICKQKTWLLENKDITFTVIGTFSSVSFRLKRDKQS